MNAPINQGQSKIKAANKLMEDMEMKLANIKTRTGISSVWSMSHSVKLVGAVALGAVLLVAAIGVSGSFIDAEAV